ncbi:2-aminoethylphosphonate--pyruvate transaminase [Rhizobiales bacterium]|uniref:2-aminoethylphosphonate--pyruvate transaminase n=1 Tax=Hongsoonwoonella zoysiae TaxID=2821844 RepID=UPI001560CFEC|nr:2-aminoethylphosphonate--pyruvate transaminase [Hongsoonwoonella zoysiae]NRG16660.1 2-aminoethylphosphonate--pyruvate transaminase [Hongsoonwoonella zoysiae]
MSGTREPVLLTPGPLTTSARVKRAMLRDWGSRDEEFLEISRKIRAELLKIAGAGDAYATVPLQGSGTYAVEAMIASFVAAETGVLVLVNGAYGRRIVDISERLGKRVSVYEVADDSLHDLGELERRLEADPRIRSVVVVHCETTSGLLNPLVEIANVVKRCGRALLVDAMSSFGALALDVEALHITALAASSNKCLQGVPGLAFVIARRDALDASAGRCSSLVLDLHGQYRQLEADGQYRFTPPTHVIAALAEALDELTEEGGPPARYARYKKNCELLIDGMRELGFETALDGELQAPIIASFREPEDGWFSFDLFYGALKRKGFAIYAGKMKSASTFRIGIIGAVDPSIISRFLEVVPLVIVEMKNGLLHQSQQSPLN